MPYISVEKDGFLYEAEYFYDENLVTVIGERGEAFVETNNMTEQAAARTALRSLIRENKIDPTDTNN